MANTTVLDHLSCYMKDKIEGRYTAPVTMAMRGLLILGVSQFDKVAKGPWIIRDAGEWSYVAGYERKRPANSH